MGRSCGKGIGERMSIWHKLSQACVIALILIAAWVAYRIYAVGQAWVWIIAYWIVLTMKNLCDFLAIKKK